MKHIAAPHPRHRRRRALLVAGVGVVVLAGAGTVVEGTNLLGIGVLHPPGQQAARGVGDSGAATSTATVTRRSLSSMTRVGGTLGYAGEYTVLGRAQGTITWLPEVGQVIQQGQVLFRVDERPVVLLYGSTPAYRALAAGMRAADVTGSDVRQLNGDLVAMGYIAESELDPSSDEFSWATGLGLERLQDALGVAATGELALGDCVFLPGPLRVTSLAAVLGGQAGGPVLKGTSTARRVTVDLDASEQSEVRAGDQVTITLPNDQTTAGRVTSVGRVATTPPASGPGGSSTPTVTVDITPTDPTATGTLDQASVQVAITTNTVQDALVVPVGALLVPRSGVYAVEVVGAGGVHRLVPVSLGLFDDADELVQVSGAGLAAGQHVVVPAG
jgi:hypothetical protein